MVTIAWLAYRTLTSQIVQVTLAYWLNSSTIVVLVLNFCGNAEDHVAITISRVDVAVVASIVSEASVADAVKLRDLRINFILRLEL